MRIHWKIRQNFIKNLLGRHLGTKFDAKLVQVGPKTGQDGLKMGQDGPKIGQDGHLKRQDGHLNRQERFLEGSDARKPDLAGKRKAQSNDHN